MKSLIAALFVTCLSTACASAPPVDGKSPEVREVAFACANGPDLSIRFFTARGIAVLVRNGEPVELHQQPSGSGFIYGNGTTTIRGKGNDLKVEVGRMAPLQCKAKQA